MIRLKLLTKIFGSKKREHVPDFEDAVLGNMHPAGEGLWGAHITIADKRIGFVIGGHTEPSSVLLAHARDILRNFAEFESMISAFLADEGRRMQMTPDEIKKLEIGEVILCWPERPDDGMIYFCLPEENIRVWHCDYIDRKPKGLGFDD